MSFRKLVSLITLALLVASLSAEEPAEKRSLPTKLEMALSDRWQVVEFGVWDFGNDYIGHGPDCVLTRLPDEKFILSYRKGSNSASKRVIALPVRYVSKAEVEKMVKEILAFSVQATAQTSETIRIAKLPEGERKAALRKQGSDTVRFIKVVVEGPTRARFESDFDKEKTTSKNYYEFLKATRSGD